ncbi:MAG: family transcriptional regulator, cyclic receptor protein, partial [Solirubrobacteraceae bacterium]|nr:family transcriptional regulator, cyclic receptor protein [Solirubrobacteraceae bacterium]
MSAATQVQTQGARAIVLDEDPDLGRGIPSDRHEHARTASVAAVISIPAGPWEIRTAVEVLSSYGLLALDGMLIRRVGLDGRYGAELLGPGDLLRPWEADGEAIPAMPFEASWRVFAPSRFAVLDLPWATRMAPHP